MKRRGRPKKAVEPSMSYGRLAERSSSFKGKPSIKSISKFNPQAAQFWKIFGMPIARWLKPLKDENDEESVLKAVLDMFFGIEYREIWFARFTRDFVLTEGTCWDFPPGSAEELLRRRIKAGAFLWVREDTRMRTIDIEVNDTVFTVPSFVLQSIKPCITGSRAVRKSDLTSR